MSKALKIFLITSAVLVAVVAIGGWILIQWLNYFPPPEIPAEMKCIEGKEPPKFLPVGKKLTALSWNIQYGASRKYKFFYDGGKTVYPEKEAVLQTLKQISQVIDKIRPDLLILQEVDRSSDRTYRIDQLKELWRKDLYPCWSSAPYHRTRYLPFPSHQHLKRVDMHLVTFSKYPMSMAMRYGLPLLRESFIRQAFNLKRAVMESSIQMEDGREFVVFNTHLSAFSFNDGTLDRQINRIVQILLRADAKKRPWLLAGDFNMLPPGDDPKRLGEDAKYFPPPDKNPIARLFESWSSTLPLEKYKKSPGDYNTYLPFGAKKADRWIDYIFHNDQIEIISHRVLTEYNQISDHLPILIEFKIKPSDKSPPVPPPGETPAEKTSAPNTEKTNAPSNSPPGGDKADKREIPPQKGTKKVDSKK